MANADAFVLSSAWEGMVNVLVEAMAFGVPLVATDCPSSPREILSGGAYGHLVPVGDADAIAKAIGKAITEPIRYDAAKASEPFFASKAARTYANYMGLL
jgi:glycosyltransferase involved in cell wall biosynthesis